MQAVILAGRDEPTPLLDIGGKPFLIYILENLRRFGVDDIVVVAGRFAAAYRSALGDGKRFARRVTIVPGTLQDARPHLRSRFLLLDGGSFFDINLLDLVARPAGGARLARLALRGVGDAARHATVTLADGRVTEFVAVGAAGPGLVPAGIAWMKRDGLNELESPPDPFAHLAARGRLSGAVYDRPFVAIGTPEDRTRAATLMPRLERRPAAFLDRDGVLNRDTGFVHRREGFVWLDGAQEAVKRLNDLGILVFVVTNQSGIARGLFGTGEVERLHRWINRELGRGGAHIDAFYYCPHHPTEGVGRYRQDCLCRKPAPGMLLQAMREWPVDRAASFMVGDKEIDMAAARGAGVRGILFAGGSVAAAVSEGIDAGRPNS